MQTSVWASDFHRSRKQETVDQTGAAIVYGAKEASGYRAVPDMGSVIYIRDVEPKKTETLLFEEQE